MSVGIVFQVCNCISFDLDLVELLFYFKSLCVYRVKASEFFLSIVVWARLFFSFSKLSFYCVPFCCFILLFVVGG